MSAFSKTFAAIGARSGRARIVPFVGERLVYWCEVRANGLHAQIVSSSHHICDVQRVPARTYLDSLIEPFMPTDKAKHWLSSAFAQRHRRTEITAIQACVQLPDVRCCVAELLASCRMTPGAVPGAGRRDKNAVDSIFVAADNSGTLQFGQKPHIEYLFAAGVELKELSRSTGADADNIDPTLALVEILCDRHAAKC